MCKMYVLPLPQHVLFRDFLVLVLHCSVCDYVSVKYFGFLVNATQSLCSLSLSNNDVELMLFTCSTTSSTTIASSSYTHNLQETISCIVGFTRFQITYLFTNDFMVRHRRSDKSIIITYIK
jgi:hypothetical protein